MNTDETWKVSNFFINNLSKHRLRVIISPSDFGHTCNVIIEDSEKGDVDIIIDEGSNSTEMVDISELRKEEAKA